MTIVVLGLIVYPCDVFNVILERFLKQLKNLYFLTMFAYKFFYLFFNSIICVPLLGKKSSLFPSFFVPHLTLTLTGREGGNGRRGRLYLILRKLNKPVNHILINEIKTARSYMNKTPKTSLQYY